MSVRGLTMNERSTLAAAMERILPPGNGPSATEVNAVGYAEWMVSGPNFTVAARAVLETGLDLLDLLADTLWGRPFALCAPEERDAVLRRAQETPHPTVRRFFLMLVRMTLTGFFCAPSYGGNRNGAGWASIGFVPHPATADALPPTRGAR
jgi:hypothetical protein